MIYETALLLAALAGSAIGGWIDLKTTEIPDIVPLSTAILGIAIHAINAYFTGSWAPLYYSFAVGLAFLAFGYVLFYTGQWGEADALLLAAIGFVLPQPLSFFSGLAGASAGYYAVIFIINTFVIGGIYSIIYAFVLALKNRGVLRDFSKKMRSGKKGVAQTLAISAGFLAVLLSALYSAGAQFSQALLLYMSAVSIVFGAVLFAAYNFAKSVEEVAFRKKVKPGELKEGDVLAKDAAGFSSKLYVGITKEQIEKLKSKSSESSEIWIKEGIRYGPVFFLSIIATALFGNIVGSLLFIGA